MPKKFGTNTKAKEAWDRKEAAKVAEKERKEKEAEDEYWKDDNKHLQKKQQRKDEKEKKKQETLEKKIANKVALEEEMSSLKGSNKGAVLTTKITRAEIAQIKEKAPIAAPKKAIAVQEQEPLTENLNRLLIEEEQARSVDEALTLLNPNAPGDRHPEKRLKAAFQAFEDKNLPLLKAENPNLRLSQLKQLLKKEWQKSPENPLNQRFTSYNSKA